MSIKEYIKQNETRFIDELSTLVSIESISAERAHAADMVRCAERWVELLTQAGMDNARVMSTAGNPVVYAEHIVSPANKTVLIYGHYDVMPVEPIELWDTPPFTLTMKDGRMYGRGADDDKGQSMMQIKGFETALRLGLVNVNVKVMLEGEEEIGSTHLEAFCQEHKEMLSADVILVSDTSMVSEQVPSLTTGLRGLAYWQVTVKGPNRDLHSGHFGGAVANPINVLCRLMADIVDDNGRITIPGFYDDVLDLTAAERDMIARIPFDLEAYKAAIGVDDVAGEVGFSTLERNSCRPSFDICGIWGGYTGEGSKTVLPAEATAKISCRLVPNQQHEHISRLMEDFLRSRAPQSVHINVTPCHGGEGYVCPIDMPAYRAAEEAMTVAFGRRPLAVRRGGSIPIISTFERVLGVKSVLMGFGLESNAIHSPNESCSLDYFRRGIETVAEFYKRFS